MELINIDKVQVKGTDFSIIVFEIRGSEGTRFVTTVDNRAVDFDSMRSLQAYMIGYFGITGVEI